ncbi:MAG: DUF92 domain-containing protein [Fimbriimonadaceae bacterium]|nr:DUF92 domain-containing protein [Fimbriimonadaceae bacterium]
MNSALGLLGWRVGAITPSGVLAGAVYGLLIYLGAGPVAYAVLALLVVAGSGFTRLGYRRKVALGAAQERRGARTWRNATANCAVAAAAAVGSAVGWGDAWLAACLGALAAALADTTESELGMLAGRRAYLLLPPRRVAPGTEGAVSLEGSLLGWLAAALALAVACAGGLLPWAALPLLATAAWLGTVTESLLAGGRALNNELLNTVTTLTGAVLAGFASGLWW